MENWKTNLFNAINNPNLSIRNIATQVNKGVMLGNKIQHFSSSFIHSLIGADSKQAIKKKKRENKKVGKKR